MSLRKPGLWLGLITLGALALNLWLRLTPFDFVWDGRVPWERLSLGPLTRATCRSTCCCSSPSASAWPDW